MSAQPLVHYGPAPTDSGGVLSCWVQQPVQDAISESQSGLQLMEKWKGPYKVGKAIGSSIEVGDLLAKVHTVLGANRISRISSESVPPTRDGNSGVWVLEGWSIEEIKAGDHCILTLKFGPDYSDSSGSETLYPELDPTTDVWSLTWQAYNVSPYAFCKNERNFEYDDTRSVEDTADLPLIDSEDYSNRRLVERYLQAEDKLPEFYAYSDPNFPGNIIPLTLADRLVLEKVQKNKTAVYHHPILTHQFSHCKYDVSLSALARVDYDADADVGAHLDEICEDIDAQCPTGTRTAPYTIDSVLDEYTWVMVDDTVTQQIQQQKTGSTANVIFTRKMTYWGVKDADVNFYGHKGNLNWHQNIDNNRWEIGNL